MKRLSLGAPAITFRCNSIKYFCGLSKLENVLLLFPGLAGLTKKPEESGEEIVLSYEMSTGQPTNDWLSRDEKKKKRKL